MTDQFHLNNKLNDTLLLLRYNGDWFGDFYKFSTNRNTLFYHAPSHEQQTSIQNVLGITVDRRVVEIYYVCHSKSLFFGIACAGCLSSIKCF